MGSLTEKAAGARARAIEEGGGAFAEDLEALATPEGLSGAGGLIGKPLASSLDDFSEEQLVNADKIGTAGFDEVGLGAAEYVKVGDATSPDKPYRKRIGANVCLLLNATTLEAPQCGAKGDGNDDGPALQDLLDFASEKPGRRVLLPQTGKYDNGTTRYVTNQALTYRNRTRIESTRGVILAAAAGATFADAMLRSSLADVVATDGQFQADKFDLELVNLAIDMELATAGHGILIVADRPYVQNVRTRRTPWCGIKQQHTGLSGSEQVSGNMLLASYDWIRIDNGGCAFRSDGVNDSNIPEDQGAGLWLGANQNGKITDGFLSRISILSCPVGLKLGTGAGWIGNSIRIANTDDAIIARQPTRFDIDQLVIDDFGRGWDKAKREFYGLLAGVLLTDRAHVRARGQIQCQQGAGKTSDYVYKGVGIANPGGSTPPGGCAITCDFAMQLGHYPVTGGTSEAISYGYYQPSDPDNHPIDYVGTLSGHVRDCLYPASLPENTRLATSLVRTTAEAGHTLEARGRKAVTAGLATDFLKLMVGPVEAARVELELVVNRNNGFVVASQKFWFTVGRSGSGSSVFRSSTIQSSSMASAAQSSSARNITALAVAAVTSGSPADTITVSINPTYTGTETDTAGVLSWRLTTFGQKPNMRVEAV